ncbi:hypothetical protein [Luteolibacter luteus]|uniref:DUF2383 domain-containing protein n=1 Tax=Luteolibacter luteus TaxID=2728835 RepID=A0A858RI59_9BACT|nr:hypothetical protein [Luteolibacter luteus]QJE96405.1 hypothetical protein HHL09_11635 [Luteolibacter luteus]
MNELRLPTQASSVSLQTALTRTLDAVCAYQQAASISESGLLSDLCKEFASLRNAQADRIAELMAEAGDTPDFGFSREAGFQQIWMCLVNRRFPTFREGLPRECERSDRRLERVLLRLWNDPSTEEVLRHELDGLLRDVRGGLARLHQLQGPHGPVPMTV